MDEDHSLSFTRIIDRRSQKNLLLKLDRERADISSEPVDEDETVTCGKHELNLSIIEIIHLGNCSAYRFANRHTPQALPLHLTFYQVFVLILRQSVLPACSAILHSERTARHNDDGIPEHRIDIPVPES